MIGPALLIVVESGEDLIDDGTVAVLLTAVQRALPDVHVVPARISVHEPALGAVIASELAVGEPVVAVPLMLSPGVRVHDDLAGELERDRTRRSALVPALGSDDAVIELMARRLHRTGLAAGDVVVMAAAGSSDHHAVRDSIEVGRRLAHVLERYVTVGFFTAAAPRLAAAVDTMRRLHPGSRVAVASYLLSPGRFTEAADDAGGDLVAAPLLIPGHRAPTSLVALLIERYSQGVAQLDGAAAEHP